MLEIEGQFLLICFNANNDHKDVKKQFDFCFFLMIMVLSMPLTETVMSRLLSDRL